MAIDACILFASLLLCITLGDCRICFRHRSIEHRIGNEPQTNSLLRGELRVLILITL